MATFYVLKNGLGLDAYDLCSNIPVALMLQKSIIGQKGEESVSKVILWNVLVGGNLFCLKIFKEKSLCFLWVFFWEHAVETGMYHKLITIHFQVHILSTSVVLLVFLSDINKPLNNSLASDLLSLIFRMVPWLIFYSSYLAFKEYEAFPHEL